MMNEEINKNKIITFGRYKNKTINDIIINNDISYLKWCICRCIGGEEFKKIYEYLKNNNIECDNLKKLNDLNKELEEKLIIVTDENEKLKKRLYIYIGENDELITKNEDLIKINNRLKIVINNKIDYELEGYEKNIYDRINNEFREKYKGLSTFNFEKLKKENEILKNEIINKNDQNRSWEQLNINNNKIINDLNNKINELNNINSEYLYFKDENEKLIYDLKNKNKIIDELRNNNINNNFDNNNIFDNKELKKEIFILKNKINDYEYKIKNYHFILSNFKKYFDIINENKNIDLPFINRNNNTYNNVTKWSKNKMRNYLKDNNILINKKSTHEMKQQINQLNNIKFERLVDRIIELKK